MRYPGSAVTFADDFPVHRLTANAHFRANPTTASTSLKIFPAGTAVAAFPFTVTGQALTAGDQWQPALMYVESAYVDGFFHASVLERVNTDDGLQASLDAATTRAATIKTEAITRLKRLSLSANSDADALAKL